MAGGVRGLDQQARRAGAAGADARLGLGPVDVGRWAATRSHAGVCAAYDDLGRRVRRTLPMGQVEDLVCDVAGRLSRHTSFRGFSTDYAYDAMGQVTAVAPDARLAEAGVSFTYTPDGGDGAVWACGRWRTAFHLDRGARWTRWAKWSG